MGVIKKILTIVVASLAMSVGAKASVYDFIFTSTITQAPIKYTGALATPTNRAPCCKDSLT